MTLLSTLGYAPIKKYSIPVPYLITPNDISIVIPVKNNQCGVLRFLADFLEVTPEEYYPLEIIIVDNNSDTSIRIPDSYPIKLILTSCSSIGPAAARNKGVSLSRGNWLLFNDSDCIPTSTTVSGYCISTNKSIAYAGGIEVISGDSLSQYYRTQETLIPPKAICAGKKRPDYLVTANCLILRQAFNAVGGFDISFKQAGGEDIDIAFRLLEIGELEYQFNSVTRHSFDDGMIGFVNRFKRYGLGNKQLANKFALDLKPRLFLPQKISLTNLVLALVQYLAMRYGYMQGK